MAKKKKNQLSKEDHDKILRLFTDKLVSINELAKQYQVSQSGIRNIINNKRSVVINHRQLYGRNEARTEDVKDEVWVPLQLKTKTHYMVSNYGRIKSFYGSENGTIIKGKMNAGYLQFDYVCQEEKKKKSTLVHRIVATHFLPQPAENELSIIHLDGNKANNAVTNLKWVTRSDASAFGIAANPDAIKQRALQRTQGAKLTLGKVEMIRKLLADPNRKTRKKMIAKQFGISEMSLYRIQNGVMWGQKGTQLEYNKKEVPDLLSEEKVKAIKEMLRDKQMTQKQIAAHFQLSESVISRIKSGKTYRNID